MKRDRIREALTKLPLENAAGEPLHRCRFCDGSGKVNGKICPECKGAGLVRSGQRSLMAEGERQQMGGHSE